MLDILNVSQFERVPLFEKALHQSADRFGSFRRGEVDLVVLQQDRDGSCDAGRVVLLHGLGPLDAGVVLRKFRQQAVAQVAETEDSDDREGRHDGRCESQHVAGSSKNQLADLFPDQFEEVAAEQVTHQTCGGEPPTRALNLFRGDVWPERPASAEPQQSRRKSQRCHQDDGQADRDGHTGLTELAEVRKDHHADSAHHSTRAGDQGVSDFSDRTGHSRGCVVGLVQLFFKPRDQEQAIVDAGSVAQHFDVNFNPVEKSDPAVLCQQCQQCQRELSCNGYGDQRNQGEHRAPVNDDQQCDHKQDCPKLCRLRAFRRLTNHVAADGCGTAQCQP